MTSKALEKSFGVKRGISFADNKKTNNYCRDEWQS